MTTVNTGPRAKRFIGDGLYSLPRAHLAVIGGNPEHLFKTNYFIIEKLKLFLSLFEKYF